MQLFQSSKKTFKFSSFTSNVLFFAILAIFTGCGFFGSERTIETEKEEQVELLDGLAVTYWKGAKISIRSLPIPSGTDEIDFENIKQEQQSELGLGKHLSRIYDWQTLLNDEESNAEALSVSELIELAKEVYDMTAKIKDMDEDDFPTMMEVISNSRNAMNKGPIDLPASWNKSMEHWLFAVVMEAKLGFGSWKTYELNRTNISDFKTTDFKTLANLHKGLDHLRNDWPYLAEKVFSENLTILDSKIELTPEVNAMIMLMKTEKNNVKQQFEYQIKAFNYLLRGFARKQTENKELEAKALEDIQQSINHFYKAGIDNELVWIAESYLYIKLEEKEKAIASLNKLKSSEYFHENEKEILQEAIDSIEDRDPDAALNFVSDKIIMYKLGLSYTMSYFNEIQWLQILEQSDEGKAVLEKFDELEQEYKKAKKYLDIDELSEKGKSMLNL